MIDDSLFALLTFKRYIKNIKSLFIIYPTPKSPLADDDALLPRRFVCICLLGLCYSYFHGNFAVTYGRLWLHSLLLGITRRACRSFRRIFDTAR